MAITSNQHVYKPDCQIDMANTTLTTLQTL